MHQVVVVGIGVSEDYLLHVILADQLFQLFFGVNGDPLRIKLARQGGRIEAPLDVGDLGGGEGHYLIDGIVAEEGVEVVEVTPSGSHNDDADRFCHAFNTSQKNRPNIKTP